MAAVVVHLEVDSAGEAEEEAEDQVIEVVSEDEVEVEVVLVAEVHQEGVRHILSFFRIISDHSIDISTRSRSTQRWTERRWERW